MTDDWTRIYDLVRVLAAVAALVISPQIIAAAIKRVRRKALAVCEPRLRSSSFSPRMGVVEIYKRVRGIPSGKPHGVARVWNIRLENVSRRITGIALHILTQSQGNRARAFKRYSENDGGLVISDEGIDNGALMINARRWHPSRFIDISVVFEKPDQPIIIANLGHVQTRFLLLGLSDREEVSPIITYERILLIYAMFVGVTIFLSIRMIYLYFTMG